MAKLSRRTMIIIAASLNALIIILSITFVVLINQPQSYEEHGPIVILKDEDFDFYNFPGKGTAKKPFLIQNLNITSSQRELIYISGTTKCFVIQNCYLRKFDLTDLESEQTGIFIADAADDTVKITNNILNASCYGIEVYNSKGVIIENNVIDILPVAGWAGPYSPYAENIKLDNCSFSKVEENTCYFGDISISSSENSTFVENSCYGRGIGISESESVIILGNYFQSKFHLIEYGYYRDDPVVSFTDSPYTLLSNNIMDDCDFSTSLSPYSEIRNNKIFDGGYNFNHGSVSLMYDSTVVVENNLVNDKPLGYFINEQEIMVSAEQFGQLFFFNCSEITVENQVIHNVNTGMTFHECGTIQLINNTITSSNRGVRISQADKLEVIDNHLDYNNYALEAGGGIDFKVVNNTCNFNYQAMGLDEFDYLQIENNTLLNNTRGIYVDNITNSTIKNNTLTSDGIFYNPSRYGIFVENSDNIIIDQNSMLARFTHMELRSSINLTITNNVLIDSAIGIGKTYLSTYTISNNTINDKKIGAFFNEENQSIYSPDYGQLYLFNCSNFNISNQIMEIDTTVIDSTNISFSNCSWTDFFASAISFENSYNCNLTNCTLSSSPTYMDGRNYSGIYVHKSSFCTITYTLIEYCMSYGLFLDEDSYNNSIHHNAFIENALNPFESHQAADYGYNNSWYDIAKLEGNFWFDYDFSGSYSIWGDAGSEDLYPLLTNPL